MFVESRGLGAVKTLFFIFILVYGNSVFGSQVDERLKQVSSHDCACMRVFFDQAIKFDQAAHVLFFRSKPVCQIGIALKYRDKTYHDILALKGWNAFKKKEHLFPHPHFLFSESTFEANVDCKILHIYLINKETLKTYLSNHKFTFQEVLGDEFSPEMFIAQLEEGVQLPRLLNNDEMLLGILLGYGEESSLAFREKRAQATAPLTAETYARIELMRPPGCKIEPVVFMGNSNSIEVKNLISTYEKELETAWMMYHKSRNPLKLALEKLCEF